MSNAFGRYLEQLRGGLTLREAAHRSGLSHTYIRDLELGLNRSTGAPIHPSPETLKKLADSYGCSYELLMSKAGYLRSPLDHTHTQEGEPDKEMFVPENAETDIFFKEYLEAPEQRRKDLLKFWSFLKQQDRQQEE